MPPAKEYVPLDLISKVELSRRLGVSRQYISEQVSKGNIGVIGKGRAQKVNMDDPTTIQFVEWCKFTKGTSPNPQTVQVVPAAQVPPVAPAAGPTNGAVPPSPSVYGNEFNVNGEDIDLESVDIRFWDKAMITRLKAIEDVKTARLNREIKRKQYIPKDVAQKVFHKLFMIHTGTLSTLGIHISPEVSAIYGDDDPAKDLKVEEMVTKKIYNALEQIKRELNKWLSDQKCDPIIEEE